jgi:signal peptidase II
VTQQAPGSADPEVAPPDGESGEESRPAGRTATVRAAMALLLGIAVFAVALDQWTKELAVNALSDGSVERLLGGAVYLDLTRNSGAAFSMFSDFTFVFPIFAIVISGLILWFARGLRSWPWALALGLIMGGALGNLVDRLFRSPGPFRGHVVDFISVFAPAGEKFPIFNIADSALTVGVALAIGLELFRYQRDGTRLVKAGDGAGGHA